ncbi:hypothetical protein P0D88_53535, partial [Paraburkholderia sp. RL18-103-BIB-C]|uniref:hypothetical protein n=1 Tax=unclassified Paraburkholderia TaxID=2615204 RepID=UPI0038B89AE9
TSPETENLPQPLARLGFKKRATTEMVDGWRSFSSEKLSEAHRPMGTVKLSVDERPNMNDVRKPNLSCKAHQHWRARHAFPGLEGLGISSSGIRHRILDIGKQLDADIERDIAKLGLAAT